MARISEAELVLPTLLLLARSSEGLTTTDLIHELERVLEPSGMDLEILANRRDTHFSQKVRNLVSHRTLGRQGLAVYYAGRHSITNAGLLRVEEARANGELSSAVIPGPTLPASAVFPRYRRADEAPATRRREPFEVDPDVVDRALSAHAATQNALADWVREGGNHPFSPGHGPANFDVAWIDAETLFVAEVKSLTVANETIQLRLGLGQVLDYQALLEAHGQAVRPVLAVERRPTDARWVDLCSAHGVTLVWPGEFDRIAG